MAVASGNSRLAVLIFTDVVGSTELKSRIGTSAYARLIARHDQLFRGLLKEIPSAEVLADTGDGCFAAFPTVSDAVRVALCFQHALQNEPGDPAPLRTRIGIHIGEILQLHEGATGKPKVVGMAADMTARLMSLAAGNQILLTRPVFDEARQYIDHHPCANDGDGPPLRWIAHGNYVVKGNEDPIEVFEVGAEGLAPLAPPPDSEKVHRLVAREQEQTLGWRPAIGLTVPQRPGWVVQKKLGEGGFGEVWLAQNERTKQHRVFKFCFDADRLRSFKRELTLFRLLRDALGERADIAKLYDVKLNEPPFFLESEYTPGGNLADWADAQGGIDTVPMSTRLDLIAAVADAVAAAHSVAVLHKDIKPSNILIHVAADGRITPRLCDFGIGILSDPSQLAARGITVAGFTQLSHNESSRTGTQLYSPPEMLTGQAFTVQGDVYALGVLLYQVVIGDLTRPLAPGWERDVDDELLREDIGRCVDGRPSHRLSSAAELSRRLRSLDARRRDRQREAAAADVARRRKYQLRLAAGASVVLVLLVLVAGYGYWRERGLRESLAKSYQQEATLRKQAVEQAKAVELSRDTAERAVRQATAMNEFFQQMLLGPTDPSSRGMNTTVAELLERAADSVDKTFASDPTVGAGIHDALGRTYQQLNQYPQAEAQFRKALELRERTMGPGDDQTLQSVNHLAGFLNEAGQPDQAEKLLRDYVARQNTQSHSWLMARLYLCDFLISCGKPLDSPDMLSGTLQERVTVVVQDLMSLGSRPFLPADALCENDAAFQQAKIFYRHHLDECMQTLGSDASRTLVTMYMLAEIALLDSDPLEAENRFRQLLPLAQKRFGPDHPFTLYVVRELAASLDAQKKPAAADAIYDDLVNQRMKQLGPDHPATLIATAYRLARLEHLGRFADALEARRDLLARQRRVYGEFHPQTLASMEALAKSLMFMGKTEDGEKVLRAAIETAQEKLGAQSRVVLSLQAARSDVEKFQIAAVSKASFKVTAVEGIAQYRIAADQPWAKIVVGQELPQGAEVRTGPRSAVQLKIGEQVVVVERLTVVKVTLHRGAAGDVGIKYGRMRYDLEGGGLERQSLLRSPNATLAVRG